MRRKTSWRPSPTAENLTERKRTFSCGYEHKNSREVILGQEDTLIPDPVNFHKYELNTLIEYWRKEKYEEIQQTEGRRSSSYIS